MRLARRIVLVVVLSTCAGPVLSAQSASTQGIRAKDGDTVLVEGAGKVKIIRRREAEIRAIHNPAERWLVLLVDYPAGSSKTGDGGLDMSYTFHDISEWPLGERWVGPAIVDDYLVAGEMPFFGIGLSTSSGFVQLLAPNDRHVFKDPASLALYYNGMGRSGGGGQSMDVAEAREVEQARRNAASRSKLPDRARGIQTSIGMEVTGAGGIVVTPGSSGQPAPGAPVRVGGTIRTPARLHSVEPVLPEAAAKAGIFGMVILEIIIGTDGSVTDAKVLRSIPMLDKAAVDAVKGWRYAVTHLNGQPVPVITTVTVNFR
jgi:TonB family protein